MSEPEITLEQAKALVSTRLYPRVTEESIKSKIADTDYVESDHLTICIITMYNGFKFVGKAAPADDRNFDPLVGHRYAYEDAFKQIWTHEGYLLREALYNRS